MDSKAKKVSATEELAVPGPRFTEAQRSNLTRLIEGSRFSVVRNDLTVRKVTGKPIG
jgi:hypothetical protein